MAMNYFMRICYKENLHIVKSKDSIIRGGSEVIYVRAINTAMPIRPVQIAYPNENLVYIPLTDEEKMQYL
jgi:hypothetical protein